MLRLQRYWASGNTAATELDELLEERRRQNSTLIDLLPSYLEAVAAKLLHLEPKLAQPAKRAKWVARMRVKV